MWFSYVPAPWPCPRCDLHINCFVGRYGDHAGPKLNSVKCDYHMLCMAKGFFRPHQHSYDFRFLVCDEEEASMWTIYRYLSSIFYSIYWTHIITKYLDSTLRTIATTQIFCAKNSDVHWLLYRAKFPPIGTKNSEFVTSSLGNFLLSHRPSPRGSSSLSDRVMWLV